MAEAPLDTAVVRRHNEAGDAVDSNTHQPHAVQTNTMLTA